MIQNANVLILAVRCPHWSDKKALFRCPNEPGSFNTAIGFIVEASGCTAVAMADAFAQATGNAAFVNLHSAAGLGNGLGTLYTAFRNQSPLIITAGQQTRSLLPYDPYLGAERPTEFPRPYVKWACEPARAEDVPVAIAQAYAIAMERPRGPVFVSIPSDDWDKPTAPVHARRNTWDMAPPQESIDELANALAASKKAIRRFLLRKHLGNLFSQQQPLAGKLD